MTSQPVLAPPPATSGDESDLITRIRPGDPAALSTAYRLYAADLLALGYRLTGSAADAEDVVQDLFVGLPEALERHRDQGRLRPWLRKITVRLALMRLRSGRRRGEVDLAAAGTSLAAPAGRSDDDVYLWHGLEQLPEDQRAIVVLRVVEGYGHAAPPRAGGWHADRRACHPAVQGQVNRDRIHHARRNDRVGLGRAGQPGADGAGDGAAVSGSV